MTGKKCKLCELYMELDSKYPKCLAHRIKPKVWINEICQKCERYATYGFKKTSPTRCVQHKERKMIIVSHIKCKRWYCEKRPSYGLRGGIATMCKDHKENGMIVIRGKRCDICELLSSFGFKGGRLTRCKKHKIKGMIWFKLN